MINQNAYMCIFIRFLVGNEQICVQEMHISEVIVQA